MLSRSHDFIRNFLIKIAGGTSLGIGLTAFLTLLSTPSLAEPEHSAASSFFIATESSVVTKQLLETAWQLMPEQALLGQLEQANRNQGSHWLWDSPNLSLDYQTKSDPGSTFDSGLPAEWQLGIELPLAGPSLWRVQSNMKQAQINLINAEQQMLRWRLAGELEQLAWTIQLREIQSAQMGRKHQFSLEQVNWLSKLEGLGERSQDEVLQARQQQIWVQTEYLQLQQSLQQSQIRWKQLTGLDFEHTNKLLIEPAHSFKVERAQSPLLSWRQAQLEVVRLNLQQNKGRNRAATLRIGLKQVEELGQQEQHNSWQIGVSLPFGSNPVSRWRSGYRAIGEAEVQLEKTHRMIKSEQKRITFAIETKSLQLSALRPLKIDLEANFLPRYQAYKQGMISVLEWRPLQQSYWDTQKQVSLAEIELKALQSQLNHLKGGVL